MKSYDYKLFKKRAMIMKSLNANFFKHELLKWRNITNTSTSDDV